MHYSKTAFKNGSDPTIITNIPDFIDVIGQRMDFSEYDLQKLNRLYNCSKFLHLFHIIWKNNLKEMRVIHLTQVKEMLTFLEKWIVLKTPEIMVQLEITAFLQKHCWVAEVSVQFYLTFS